MEPSMESCLAQVLQKDVGRRLQVGQEIIDFIADRQKSQDLEQDQTMLDRMVDAIATTWVNSSNFKPQACGPDQARPAGTGLHHRTNHGQRVLAEAPPQPRCGASKGSCAALLVEGEPEVHPSMLCSSSQAPMEEHHWHHMAIRTQTALDSSS